MDDIPRTRKRGGLFQQRILLGLGTIALVIVLCPIVLFVRTHARYRVIGPTDPVTGMRMEYTVSSDYKKKIDDEDEPKHRSHDIFTDWEYTPSSPSPWIQWLQAHLPGRLAALIMGSEGSEDITQTSSKHFRMTGWYVDSRGYVSVDLGRSSGITMAAVSSQEYKMVGDCPTTLVIEDSDLIVNGHPVQYYDLLVHPKGQTVIYMFQATGIEGTSPNPDLRELRAIRESVQIVKTK